MNKVTSSYLDGWRMIAAVVVVLSHLNDWSGKGLPFFTPSISAQGVLIFFVLSGFVISYVASRRENDWRSYAVSRAARIYSVALPALVATFVVDAMSAPLPHWTLGGEVYPPLALQIFAGATFLNEVWGHHITTGPNFPYWSLGYEVPFYICFALALFLPGRWKGLAAVALIGFGLRIAIMGLIWLMGVGTQAICRRRMVSERIGVLLFGGSLAAWLIVNVLIQRGTIPWNDAPIFWHKLRDLPGDFLTAFLFATSIVGIDAACRGRSVAPGLKAAIQWGAGATFTLYLFHVTIAQAVLPLLPVPIETAGGKLLVLASITAGTLLIASFTERRKTWWHRQFERLLSSRPPVLDPAR